MAVCVPSATCYGEMVSDKMKRKRCGRRQAAARRGTMPADAIQWNNGTMHGRNFTYSSGMKMNLYMRGEMCKMNVRWVRTTIGVRRNCSVLEHMRRVDAGILIAILIKVCYLN